MPSLVLLVGHCAMDQRSLRGWLERHFTVDVESVDSLAEAIQRVDAGDIDLVLVNRVFEFTGQRGIELVRQVAQKTAVRRTPVVLVSNFADAQSEAQQAGALPGFGKSQLHTPAALEAVRNGLAQTNAG
jgi:CheY-like chemotaxis protein